VGEWRKSEFTKRGPYSCELSCKVNVINFFGAKLRCANCSAVYLVHLGAFVSFYSILIGGGRWKELCDKGRA